MVTEDPVPVPEGEARGVDGVVVFAAEREQVVEPLPAQPPVGPVVQLVGRVVADGAPLRPPAPRVPHPQALPVRRGEVLGVGPVPEPPEALPEELRLPPGEAGPVGPRRKRVIYGLLGVCHRTLGVGHP